jgi:2-phospho-L-lactate guanylyltransferase
VGYPVSFVGSFVRAIVLPVTSLDDAKTRLHPVLSPLERAALTLAMLEDVMDATQDLPGWETWVVSPDETVLEISAGRGALGLREEHPPLGAAIRQVEEEAAGLGVDALAVLLADTPLVTTEVLARALRTLGPVVVAPSTDETGTNLLLRRPPDIVRASFGPDSYRRHLQAAAEADLPAAVVEVPELAFDLDEPHDILRLLDTGRRGRTLEVCRDMGLRERIGGIGELRRH